METKETKMLDIRTVPESVLLHAVRTMFSECYGALSMCNAIGGEQTPKWILLHTFNRAEIMQEVIDRDLSLASITTAVGTEGELVADSVAYKKMYPNGH